MAELADVYRHRFEAVLKPVADRLRVDLQEHLNTLSHIDQISTRAKSVERFLAKAGKPGEDGPRYEDPLRQIQDQVGARIVTLYLDDVAKVTELILRYYHRFEERELIPESENEFGYVGKHFVLLLPKDVLPDGLDRDSVPVFFELQVKTLFQHAWSEASHDLAYKPMTALSSNEKRMVAFTAAQAWGADRVFKDLLRELTARAEE